MRIARASSLRDSCVPIGGFASEGAAGKWPKVGSGKAAQGNPQLFGSFETPELFGVWTKMRHVQRA